MYLLCKVNKCYMYIDYIQYIQITYFDIWGISYPVSIFSFPAGSAAVNMSRGLPLLAASFTNASCSSYNTTYGKTQSVKTGQFNG